MSFSQVSEINAALVTRNNNGASSDRVSFMLMTHKEYAKLEWFQNKFGQFNLPIGVNFDGDFYERGGMMYSRTDAHGAGVFKPSYLDALDYKLNPENGCSESDVRNARELIQALCQEKIEGSDLARATEVTLLGRILTKYS